MIDRQIVNIPQFRNFTGRFDQATFRQVLASENMTEAQFREDIARALMLRQLLGPVSTGAPGAAGGRPRLCRPAARAAARRDRRRPRRSRWRPGSTPTDAEVATFYRANRAAFTIPERRVIRYALIGMEQVAQAGARHRRRDRRRLSRQQRRFTARARRAPSSSSCCQDERAGAGMRRSSCAAAPASPKSPRGSASPPRDLTFADQNAASIRAPGEPAQVGARRLRRRAGRRWPGRSAPSGAFHIVRVERVNAIPARPLEAVRAEIAAAIERRKRTEALGDLVAGVEDQLADGANFDEVGARRAAHNRHHAADHRGGPAGRRPALAGAAPSCSRCSPARSRSTPRSSSRWSSSSRPTRASPCSEVERVEPAAPPPLAPDPRSGARRFDPAPGARAGARARRRDRRAGSMAARPAARAFAEAGSRLPPPRDDRNAPARHQPRRPAGAAAAPRPVRLAAGPRPGHRRAQRGGLVRRLPRAAHARRRGQRAAAHRRRPGTSSPAPPARSSPSNSPAPSSCGAGVTRNDEAIRRARGGGTAAAE